MGQCVYMRQGQAFKSYLKVLANPGDTVTVTGPDYNASFTMNAAGSETIICKKPGDWNVSAAESDANVTVAVLNRRQTYTADVSFMNTVTVKANPSVTVTLTSNTGSAYFYSADADANGVAIVTVKRKGEFTVSSTAESTGTVLSSSPASSATIILDTNGADIEINHVRIGDVPSMSVGVYSSQTLYAAWNGPTSYYAGMRVQYKAGDYPTNVNDGTNLGSGVGTDRAITGSWTAKSFVTGALTAGTPYYFTGWSYYIVGGVTYYGVPRQGYATPVSTSGTMSWTASTTWTVPAGVRSIQAFVVGGGGGGGCASGYGPGGCGGGGGYCAVKTIAVVPGQTATITVGGGGAGQFSGWGNRGTKNGGAGGASSFTCNGTSVSASGGGGGAHGNINASGGSGGAGGGGGGIYTVGKNEMDYSANGGAGGSNGAAGGLVDCWDKSGSGSHYYSYGGSGQGSAAVTFNGVVYAGGGGGGRSRMSSAGAGGTRGGGAGGSSKNADAGSGTAGTGGGGGGASPFMNDDPSSDWTSSGWGGSGAVVIKY